MKKQNSQIELTSEDGEDEAVSPQSYNSVYGNHYQET